MMERAWLEGGEKKRQEGSERVQSKAPRADTLFFPCFFPLLTPLFLGQAPSEIHPKIKDSESQDAGVWWGQKWLPFWLQRNQVSANSWWPCLPLSGWECLYIKDMKCSSFYLLWKSSPLPCAQGLDCPRWLETWAFLGHGDMGTWLNWSSNINIRILDQ